MNDIDRLIDHVNQSQQRRNDAVVETLRALTPRERQIAREAAVVGYVHGAIAGGEIPSGSQIVADVIDACRAHRDLYPVIGNTLENAGETARETVNIEHGYQWLMPDGTTQMEPVGSRAQIPTGETVYQRTVTTGPWTEVGKPPTDDLALRAVDGPDGIELWAPCPRCGLAADWSWTWPIGRYREPGLLMSCGCELDGWQMSSVGVDDRISIELSHPNRTVKREWRKPDGERRQT